MLGDAIHPGQISQTPAPIDPSMNTAGQNDLLVEYNYNKNVYDSEQNVKAVVKTLF